MKNLINIKETNYKYAVEVENLKHFEEVVEIAGVFNKIFTSEEILENIKDSIIDIFTNNLSQEDLDKVEEYELDIEENLNEFFVTIEFDKYIKSYEAKIYLSLDKNINQLCFIQGNKPDLDKIIQNIYNDYKEDFNHYLNNIIDNTIEINTALEKLEEEKEKLIEVYRKSYTSAENQTKQKEIIAELKVILESKYNIKYTKDKVKYILEN